MTTPRHDPATRICEYLRQQLAAGEAECSPEAITVALEAARSSLTSSPP